MADPPDDVQRLSDNIDFCINDAENQMELGQSMSLDQQRALTKIARAGREVAVKQADELAALRGRLAEVERGLEKSRAAHAISDRACNEACRERDMLAGLGSAMLGGGADWMQRAEIAEARLQRILDADATALRLFRGGDREGARLGANQLLATVRSVSNEVAAARAIEGGSR